MATASPSSVPMRGYPREIFGSNKLDEKYLCNFCKLVLREPVQAFCGHRFCKACIQANISSGDEIRCAQCEKEDNESEDMSIINKEQIFPDNAIKREMSKIKVKCANSGCTWNGMFKQYELHLEQECPKASVTCDQCGKQGILREMLDAHQRSPECRSQPIQCPVGCGLIDRKSFHDHFHAKKHNVWMVNVLDEIRQKMSTLQTTPSSVNELDGKIRETNDKISALERQLAEVISRQSEAGSVTGLQGVGNIDTKIRQAIELQLQSVNERLDVKTGTFEGIASALHRELEKTITAVEKLERHRREMETQIEQNQNKIRSLERSLALKDMTMAELELKAQSMEAASYDGTFMWRVHDFNKKHQDALHGRTISIYSPPFYTTRRGYKMCARLYPNGDGMGKGSHLSLFFVVMRGNYDALLKWPFSQRVTFCMINQTGGEHVIDSFRPDPQSSSFKRPTSDMNIASGCPLFIRLEMLQNPNHGFLKDDTLFLKIAVDTSDLTDPVSNFEDRIKPVQA
ncbi:TNF receptor-associated factor 2-like isoform X2 [Mercenaria mercenaria]|uniref:TNF receptor-associated factor 2-like isoform X2 n=1 Tax=Mercenaria mercenaria TaxID=6596 RepID=UPI00234FABA2|nr:TNF receptor-associated factor 2-like isoform X2 [Mercenaria mercenaria]